jgi:RNA polymerase sigma-70 factor, ECF subfamily
MHSTESSLRVAQVVGPSDSTLVTGMRGGSEAAFVELYRIYAGRLYRVIFSITKNREDAEDVLQETMIRAFLAINSFEGKSKLLSWLTRIAINASLMALRKRRIRCEAGLGSLLSNGDDVLEDQIEDPKPTPEDLCLQRERHFQITRAISALKPPLRRVIEIQMRRECSMNELAGSLDVSLATVKARLYRARQRVAKRMR